MYIHVKTSLNFRILEDVPGNQNSHGEVDGATKYPNFLSLDFDFHNTISLRIAVVNNLNPVLIPQAPDNTWK